MLESLLMQQCFPSGAHIFIWTYYTCDNELATILAPFNFILLIVAAAAIGVVVYRRKIDSKKSWKQIAKTGLSTLKQVAKETAKDAWSTIEDFQKASRLNSNE